MVPIAGNDGAFSLQACALRVSRLAADGSAPAGVTNAICTDGIIKLDCKVVEEAGEDFTVKNACGGIKLAYKAGERFKRLDATLTLTNPDVEMHELLTASSLITSGGQSIGVSAPAVASTPSLGVFMEVWTKAWIGGGPPPGTTFTDGVTSTSTALTSATAAFTSADVGRTVTGTGIPAGTTIATFTNSTTVVLSAATTATATGVSITIGRPGAYWRYIFPSFIPSLGDFSLENAPRAVMFNGPCQENPQAAAGPFHDLPTGVLATAGRVYSMFRTSALPSTSTVGYQAVT